MQYYEKYFLNAYYRLMTHKYILMPSNVFIKEVYLPYVIVLYQIKEEIFHHKILRETYHMSIKTPNNE